MYFIDFFLNFFIIDVVVIVVNIQLFHHWLKLIGKKVFIKHFVVVVVVVVRGSCISVPEKKNPHICL